jgi:cyclohexanecarboxylate-CoA ligase
LGSTDAPSVPRAAAADDPTLGWTTDGRAVPGAAVRLGPDGEVQVRGPELFVGYADPSRTTAAITEDGWYRSGDLGELHDGWLRITGRSSDVIIRGGENLTPSEMEGHLEAHPAVAAAVVVGEPDERLGERACAFVTLAPGAGAGFDLDECARWFSSRGVARLRTPERVVVLDVLPVLASGKADRAELTRRAAR